MGASDAGVEIGGGIFPDIRDVLHCGGSGGSSLWFGYVDYVLTHWDDTGRRPSQGFPQTDGEVTKEGTGWDMGVTSTGRGNVIGEPVGGGGLHHPPPEKSCIVH